MTQTAVSSNFAKLYSCFNGSTGLPSPTFTGTSTFNGAAIFNAIVTMRAALTVLAGLYFNDGVHLEVRDGTLYVVTAGANVPAFAETNLGIMTSSRNGIVQQRVLLGPENSGGIGYRMLRVPNLPTLQ